MTPQEIDKVLKEVDEIIEDVTKPYLKVTPVNAYLGKVAKAIQSNFTRNGVQLLTREGLHIIYRPTKMEIVH